MDTEQLTRELSLKAMTAISNILSDYERGLISKAQVNTGCRAVFDTVGGLVGTETMDFVSRAVVEFRHAKGVEVKLVATGGGGKLEGYIRWCGLGRVAHVLDAQATYSAAYTDTDGDSKARDIANLIYEEVR